MAIKTEACTYVTEDANGNVIETRAGEIYTPATVADLAELFGMTVGELAEEQERRETRT